MHRYRVHALLTACSRASYRDENVGTFSAMPGGDFPPSSWPAGANPNLTAKGSRKTHPHPPQKLRNAIESVSSKLRNSVNTNQEKDLKKELTNLEREYLLEKHKVKALSEELENPMNVHV